MTDAPPRTAVPSDRLDVQVSESVGTIDVVTVRKGLTAVTRSSRETAWRDFEIASCVTQHVFTTATSAASATST